MFRFEKVAVHELLIILGITLVVLIGMFVWMQLYRRRAVERFGEAHMVNQLISGYSRKKQFLKFGLSTLAICFFIIAWANPQWGSKREKVTQKSADLFIALDLSYSMLAEDVLPSRIDRARRFAEQLVAGLKGERLGLITFAGNAYLQTPLTQDYALVTLAIRSANPYQLPTQGTAIGDAIELAEKSFEEDNKNNKALVIISDGEDHDDQANQAASDARRNGLPIFTIGVGTTTGSLIPTNVGGRRDYKRDEYGTPVRTKFNEAVLRGVAEAGRGAYFNLSDGSDVVLKTLQAEIANMEKQEFEQRVFTAYESYFQYFLGIGLLLLVVEYLISYRRNKLLDTDNLFGEG